MYIFYSKVGFRNDRIFLFFTISYANYRSAHISEPTRPSRLCSSFDEPTILRYGRTIITIVAL